MGVYSFQDCVASITGPGGSINMGAGAQVAKEGIKIASVEDKNKMTIGADGSGMNTLVASEARHLTVSLLKTSPTNAALQTLYNQQSLSSLFWGQNVIVVRDAIRGDNIVLTQAAFKKSPDLVFAEEGNMNNWEFDAVYNDTVLGTGTPEA